MTAALDTALPSSTLPQQAVALHLSISDPRSPVRVPVAPTATLRIALTAQLGARGGRLVEGGQGLSAFHSHPQQALQAAIEVLSAGTSLLADESAPIALRAILIGLDNDSDAARGAALTRAFRLSVLTRDHTLLLTQDIYADIEQAMRERARLAVPPTVVDEHPELSGLFELDWRSAAQRLPEVTGIPEPAESTRAYERLELTLGSTLITLAARDCPFTIGRDKTCALRLDNDVSSRVHGRIEFAHDKFYFADDSRNGTYLLTPQGEEVFLHHERLPLLGRGVISLGAPIVKQAGEVLRYLCRTEQGQRTLSETSAISSTAASTVS